MTIGELIGLGAGIVIPLGVLIIGGFWGMNNRIGRLEKCVGEQSATSKQFAKICNERHSNIDRRLEHIDSWRESKG